jgi:Flp pilus assembly protein TadB
MLGAICAAIACFAALSAVALPRASLRPSSHALIRASTLSPLEWRLHQRSQQRWYEQWLRPAVVLWGSRLHLRGVALDPYSLIQAGIDPGDFNGLELRVIRLLTALVGVFVGFVLALITSGGLILIPLLAWLGYIAPLRMLAVRRRRRQAAVQHDLPELVSLIRAFMSAGLPLERTLHLLSTNTEPDSVLKQEIRHALARYGLGLSIEEALAETGPRTGIDDLTTFVTAISQSKRTGSGLDATLRDQELMIRMNQRNRSTAQAAAVSTKLLGVLAGIYLPEFVILIIIPLFWGIMQRAFG